MVIQLLLQCQVCTDAVDALEVLLQAFGPEEKEITDFVEGVGPNYVFGFVGLAETDLIFVQLILYFSALRRLASVQ